MKTKRATAVRIRVVGTGGETVPAPDAVDDVDVVVPREIRLLPARAIEILGCLHGSLEYEFAGRQPVVLQSGSYSSIAAVAQSVGLPNLTYFARLFRRYVGTTPRAYAASGPARESETRRTL